MFKILLDKLKEAFASVLPVTLIVLAVSFTPLVSLTPKQLIVFAICAVLDFGASYAITLIIANNVATAAQIYGNDPVAQEAAIIELNYRIEALLNVGIGSSLMLIFISPLALLFSYTKTHKNPKIDKFIPIIGIALMVFTVLEGLFDVMTAYLPKVIEKINGAVDGSGGTEPAIIETISSGFRNIIH